MRYFFKTTESGAHGMDQAAERRERVFSIPNMMSMFRIVLIPLFSSALARERTSAAVALIALSAATDVIDGWVARRFHMVTQLGKVLDPIADKLTLLALALCLALKNSRVWPLLCVMAFKECAMLLMCVLFLRKGGRAESSCWYGKVTTALLYASMTLMMLFPNLPQRAVSGLVLLCVGWMLLCGALYVRKYWPKWQALHGR